MGVVVPRLLGKIFRTDFYIDFSLLLVRDQKTPKEIQHKDLFLPPSPPFKILCGAFSYISKRNQPEHKEFQGLKAPKRRRIQAWDSW